MSTSIHQTPVIVLFRNDLRIGDNGALAKAAESGKPVIPIFILDEEIDGQRPAGGAARWWLHHSLAVLQGKLRQLGAKLIIRRGRTDRIVRDAIDHTAAQARVLEPPLRSSRRRH